MYWSLLHERRSLQRLLYATTRNCLSNVYFVSQTGYMTTCWLNALVLLSSYTSLAEVTNINTVYSDNLLCPSVKNLHDRVTCYKI